MQLHRHGRKHGPAGSCSASSNCLIIFKPMSNRVLIGVINLELSWCDRVWDPMTGKQLALYKVLQAEVGAPGAAPKAVASGRRAIPAQGPTHAQVGSWLRSLQCHQTSW